MSRETFDPRRQVPSRGAACWHKLLLYIAEREDVGEEWREDQYSSTTVTCLLNNKAH